MAIVGNGSQNFFYQAASSILVAFDGEEALNLEASDIESRIQVLASRLFELTQGGSITADELIQSLPQDMRVWANQKSPLMGEIASSLFKAEYANYTIENRDWKDITTVSKAVDGVRGAWFYKADDGRCVVIKGQENPEYQLMGACFLRFMGIDSPDVRLVSRSSIEGRQLSDKGASYGLNTRSGFDHYILMDRVYGPNYGCLSSIEEDIELVRSNLGLLGELAVFDLVIGNFDRFQLSETSFNAGNIMFQKGVMRPIDTDCLFEAERDGFAKFALKKIATNQGDYEDKICKKLERALVKTDVENQIFPPEKLREGMIIALSKCKEFAACFEVNKQYFVDICSQRSGGLGIVFPRHVEDRIRHIQKYYKD